MNGLASNSVNVFYFQLYVLMLLVMDWVQETWVLDFASIMEITMAFCHFCQFSGIFDAWYLVDWTEDIT